MIDAETKAEIFEACCRASSLAIDGLMASAAAGSRLERLRALAQHSDAEAREIRRHLEEAAERLEAAARTLRAEIARLG